MPEILDEQIIYKQGKFSYLRRWLRGRHPEIGLLQPPWIGLSGDWETIVEVDVVSPHVVFRVDSIQP